MVKGAAPMTVSGAKQVINVDLDNMTFGVVKQLPFNTPEKSVIIKEMAPPKLNGRTQPITDIALPCFERQLALQEQQQNAAPIRPDWISSRFGKELEAWGMPHISFHDLRHSAATNMYQMTVDFYTVGEPPPTKTVCEISKQAKKKRDDMEL